MPSLFKKYGKYIGYGLFTLVMVVYFSFLCFPYDQVKDRYLARQMRGMPYRVSIDEVRATPFLWILARGVDVSEVKKNDAAILKVREVRMRPSLLRLALGKLSVRFKAEIYGGKVSGRATKGKDLDLDLHWKNIALAELPAATRLPGAELQGRLEGDVDLRMDIQGNLLVPKSGNLTAGLEEGSARNLQVQGFALPGLEGITGKARITLGQKQATVDDFLLEADLLTFGLEGKILLARQLLRSSLDLKGRVRLSGDLAAQYQPMLAGFLRNQDRDGFYIFSVKGRLDRPIPQL